MIVRFCCEQGHVQSHVDFGFQMTCVLLKFWNYRLHPTKENLCQLSNFTRQSNQGRGSEEQAIVCKAMTKEKSLTV